MSDIGRNNDASCQIFSLINIILSDIGLINEVECQIFCLISVSIKVATLY